MHDSNTIIKFTDDPTVVGLITNDEEAAYRKKVRDLAVCCQDNNHSLNKTKELLMDYRKWRCEHAHIHIDGAVVERVWSLKILSVHITKELTWSTHTVVKRARLLPFPLRRLKGLFPDQNIFKDSCQPSHRLLSLCFF